MRIRLMLLIIVISQMVYTDSYSLQKKGAADDAGTASALVDFDNREKRHFGEFHIDLPASWTLDEVKDISYAGKGLSGRMGGKNFSAEIAIEFHSAADQKTVDQLISSWGKDTQSDNTRLIFLRSEGYEDSTHNAKFFYHLFEDKMQSGFSVTGILSSKKGDKFAVVKLIVSFAKGNPKAQDATSYLKKSSDIVRSFRIEGL